MSVIGANKLVLSSGTYLCSMQGHMCRIATLGGKMASIKFKRSMKLLLKDMNILKGDSWT